jgi:acyl carrier protein
MDDTAIHDQVVSVIAKTFGLSGDQNIRTLRMGSLSQWDSLGHMRLVPDLEKQFRVRFPVYMIAELVDVDSIVRAIQKLSAT